MADHPKHYIGDGCADLDPSHPLYVEHGMAAFNSFFFLNHSPEKIWADVMREEIIKALDRAEAEADAEEFEHNMRLMDEWVKGLEEDFDGGPHFDEPRDDWRADAAADYEREALRSCERAGFRVIW